MSHRIFSTKSTARSSLSLGFWTSKMSLSFWKLLIPEGFLRFNVNGKSYLLLRVASIKHLILLIFVLSSSIIESSSQIGSWWYLRFIRRIFINYCWNIGCRRLDGKIINKFHISSNHPFSSRSFKQLIRWRCKSSSCPTLITWL